MTTVPAEEPNVVGWLQLDELVADWPDAPEEPRLTALATAAHEQCVAFAPELPVGATPPASWGEAQRLQLMHLWARAKAGNGDGYGPEGFIISTYPLVLEARSLLRPKRSPLRGLR